MRKIVAVDSLTPHPVLEEIIPPLTEEEFTDLLQSISQFGMLQMVVCDGTGTIIDGRNRWRAAKQLGMRQIEVEMEVALSPEMCERLGIELNANRRQWSRLLRSKAIERLLILDSRRSDREIARSAGVSHSTVADVRRTLISTGQIVQLDKRLGRDGRERSVKAIASEPVPVKTGPRKPKTESAVAMAHDGSKNGKKEEPFGARAGPKIPLPDGVTPEDAVRELIPFRKEGGSIAEAAKRIQVNASTFTAMERIVMLADREDLSPDDKSKALYALSMMNVTRQAAPAFREVEDLFTRVYGDSRWQSLDKREAARQDTFERGYGALIEACSRSAVMDVPYLSQQRAEEILAEIDEALSDLRTLRTRIKEYAP